MRELGQGAAIVPTRALTAGLLRLGGRIAATMLLLTLARGQTASAAIPSDLVLVVYDPISTQTYLRDLGTATFTDIAGQTFASDANWSSFFVLGDAGSLRWSIIGATGNAAANGSAVYSSVAFAPYTPSLVADSTVLNSYRGISTVFTGPGSFINAVTTSAADWNVIAQDASVGTVTSAGLSGALSLVKQSIGVRNSLTTTQYSAAQFTLDAAGVLSYGACSGAVQVISFPAPASRAQNAPAFRPAATSSANLPVSYASLTPAVCSVVGIDVTLLAPGTCTLAADQSGNSCVPPAAQVQASFQVTDAVGQFPQLAAGDGHTCALDPSGAVWCWGSNSFGQLGNATFQSALTAVRVNGLDTGVTAIAAGDHHNCAIRTGGAVVCWGNNASGQLGNGNSSPSATPTPVSGLPVGGALGLALGAEHSCALTASGIYCWGSQKDAQLGLGVVSALPQPLPQLVNGLPFVPTGLAAGSYHSCAWNAGATYCWGYNAFGQVGSGQISVAAPVASPVQVPGLDRVTSLVAGSYHSCAERDDGSVLCWGNNAEGEGGIGSLLSPLVTPTLSLPGPVGRPMAIASASGFHACALGAAGDIDCWGYNAAGQLGDGSLLNRSVPTRVAGLGVATAVATGSLHSCAVLVGGQVQCWGDNALGQLGNGTVSASPMPVVVSGLILAPAPQIIRLPILPDVRVTAAPFALTGSASSGLPLAYASATPTICTTSANTLTVLSPGVCTVSATQGGNPAYAAAAQVTTSFNVLPLIPQTITFVNLLDQVLAGTPVTLTATSSSGLTVGYQSGTPAVCAVAGDRISLIAAGICSISAVQAGTLDYAPALAVTQVFNVLRASQAIDFPLIAGQTMATVSFVPPVTANSGLAVVLRSSTTAVCSTLGTTITFNAPGICTITAQQSGNANYLPAPSVAQSFDVSLAPQFITFAPLPNMRVGAASIQLAAGASSKLPVYFLSVTPSVCSVVGDQVTALAPGLCTIVADAPGSAIFAVAPSASQSFRVLADPTALAPDGDVPLPPWALALLAIALAGFATAQRRSRIGGSSGV